MGAGMRGASTGKPRGFMAPLAEKKVQMAEDRPVKIHRRAAAILTVFGRSSRITKAVW